MPLDHYVSQVHLKNFYSPALDGQMYAIRKSDLKRFSTGSRSVCRIEDGSTNAYLREDRVVEKFLLDVEPKYNTSVAKLQSGQIDQECIYAVVGFIAYVVCCSLAVMRINSGPIEGMVKATATMLDERGLIEKAPASLGEKSISELLAEGALRPKIDPKYPQAIGIASIVRRVSLWGNSRWEILENDDAASPFFTSDYPVAIDKTKDRFVQAMIVPLTPDLAVRIVPNADMRGATPDFSFPKFSNTRRALKRHEIRRINGLLVRCAEDFVFFRDNHRWVHGFVAKNRNYRIGTIKNRIRRAGGGALWFSQSIMPHKRTP
jgi:Protein of unknown function (DUF4238)